MVPGSNASIGFTLPQKVRKCEWMNSLKLVRILRTSVCNSTFERLFREFIDSFALCVSHPKEFPIKGVFNIHTNSLPKFLSNVKLFRAEIQNVQVPESNQFRILLAKTSAFATAIFIIEIIRAQKSNHEMGPKLLKLSSCLVGTAEGQS